MSSKKEEERNEKIIRGLMKLPPNRRCINCDSLGPQYVCTNFWTFICITCSGIHREFTHRVKSVSMAKFTSAEVEALQRGGNQRAREAFLNGWDEQKMRLPSSSNVDKIREFIKNVYVDKKYAGTRSFDKPPRETQSHKDHEDHRRANSYHSFSQSPPNEHQYEDRRYGKPTAVLSRKPGSDRGHEGKISSFLYSPGRPGEQMQEDRFANESGGSRISDYSLSSPVDPFRSAVQSPNSEGTGFNSPPQQVRDILIENARPQTLSTSSEANAKHDFDGIRRSQIQRTASASSYGSVDVNSASNFASLIDLVSGPEQTSGAKKAETAVFPSSHVSASAHSTNYDLFNVPVVKQNPLAPPVDLFASINAQDSFAASSNDKSFGVPFPEDVGWATFDLAHHLGPASGTNKTLPSGAPFGDEAPQGSTNANPSISNNSQWLSVQSFASNRPPLMTDQWHTGLNEVKGPVSPKNSQSWNAFEDSSGNISQTSSALTQNGGAQFMGSFQSGYPKPDLGASSIGVNVSMKSVGGPSFALPVLHAPGGMPLERKPSNPFDFTYETDPEVNNMFMDMSSLQASLPNPQLPTTFLDGLSQPWFSQNSISTYVPSGAQGDLAYMAGQVSSSQLSNIPTQGPVASLGGNPFA